MSHRKHKKLKCLSATLIIAFISLLFIYPFVWMFFSSFKDNREIYQTQQLIPEKMTPSYYQENRDLSTPESSLANTSEKASTFRLKRKQRFEAQLSELQKLDSKTPEHELKITELQKKIQHLEQESTSTTDTLEKSTLNTPPRSFSESLKLAIHNIDFRYFDILINSNKRNLTDIQQQIQTLEATPKLTPQQKTHLKKLKHRYEQLSPYQYFDFRKVFWNSLFVALLHALGVVFLTASAAYVFAKFDFKGKKTLFILAILVILIPKQSLILPLFEWINIIGLSNSHFGVILPGMLNALGFIFFIQIYKQVPDDLLDLYRLEGTNEVKTFFYSLPLVSSALLSFGLIDFIMTWNEHLFPLIILQDPSQQTLPLALSQLMGSSLGEPLAVIMAGSLFTLLHSLILFAFMYRRIKSAMSDLILH